MTDYTKFDAALLAEIRKDSRRLGYLMDVRRLRNLAVNILGAEKVAAARLPYASFGIVGRVFDRRLQALRRAGKIRYTGKVWEADHGKA